MNIQSTSRAEINICLFLIAVCAVVLWESRLIPPGTFEPLGSAPVPQWTAATIIVLCLVTIARAFRARGDSVAATNENTADTHQPRHLDALLVMLLTIVYGLVLHGKAVSFSLSTVVFLFMAMGWLVRFNPRAMVPVTVIALVMGFGCQYVFTKVFVVDLPGAF